MLLGAQMDFVEVSEGYSGLVWLAFLGILFCAVRWGSGLSLPRSFAASVILLVLLPLTAVAFLPIHMTFPGWLEAGVVSLAYIAVSVTVVAFGFRAGLTRRVIVSMVAAHITVMLVGIVSSLV